MVAITRTQSPRIKRDITALLLLQRAPGGRPCGARSPLPVGCSPRPVTGQADRGIPQPSSF
ncbi:hypothetical protein AW116_17155 [Escherichia coli]|nr:hypothetical protein AWP55_14370 [Escherichia coli]ORG08091.1 hypothetical protein B5Z78_22315 [Salmonella enterica subsp. enterica serovar Typhimurium]OKW10738.1 hypothetical protein AWP72_22295 [Escherichia coli]OKW32355.1 hypothetical protein AWP74_11615 [Escherichia coli]OTC45241.1 hypothetical protein AW078_26555 [Escherichia coli]